MSRPNILWLVLTVAFSSINPFPVFKHPPGSEADCYVTVCLPSTSTRVYRSKVVANSKNPEWNETFTVRVADDLKVRPLNNENCSVQHTVFCSLNQLQHVSEDSFIFEGLILKRITLCSSIPSHTTTNTNALSKTKDYMLSWKFWLYYWSEHICYFLWYFRSPVVHFKPYLHPKFAHSPRCWLEY